MRAPGGVGLVTGPDVVLGGGGSRTEGTGLPEWAFAAALAGLPYLGWERLTDLLAGRPPSAAWDRVLSGEAGAPLAVAAAAACVPEVAAAHRTAGVEVLLLGSPAYPAALAGDHEAAPVLFRIGSPAAMAPDRPRVGMIGTRRATGYGRDVARQLGRELAEAGVGVVSGLALGIDGAAHEGAVAGDLLGTDRGAGPVGVVGSGLDVVYPRRHARLWADVAARGVVLSEAPLGARPEPWRFPARNRLIAALSDVLVVVESHAAGGSMHTVRAAADRGVTVMAVPGPIRSPASAGTNRLLAEGCPPACDTRDVLVALDLETAARPPRPDPRPRPTVTWEATRLDAVLARTDLSPPEVATALAHLEQQGWARSQGGWWERSVSP
jgi:DNA processing protein